MGAIFYFLYRQNTYFLSIIGVYNRSFVRYEIMHNIPTFIHTFSFGVIHIGILKIHKTNYNRIILFWVLFGLVSEVLQKYNSFTFYLQSWFSGIPFLENTKNYFIYGTYDFADVVSVLVGGLCAAVYTHGLWYFIHKEG